MPVTGAPYPGPMPAAVRLVTVPYDSGRHRTGLGAGPDVWVAADAAGRLARDGRPVSTVEVVGPPDLGELASAFAVAREVAHEVRGAWDEGASPVVLAGNCGASSGVLAGLPDRTGVLWLDAHGDLQLPSTTTSGFVDGMCLSAITGRCWQALAATVPGFAPVRDERVVLVGGHALDPAEERLLAGSGIEHLTVDRVRAGDADQVVDALADRVDRVHVHLDLDVHDPSAGRANRWATPGGLHPEEVVGLLRAAAGRLPLASMTLASWDPSLDHDGRMREVGLALLEVTGELLGR